MTNPFLGNPFADLTEDLEDDPFADLTADLKPKEPPKITPLPTVRVTADAPRNPVAQGMARAQLAQRGQLQAPRLRVAPPRENDFTLSVMRGLGEGVYATAQGFANLADKLPGIENAGESVRRQREEFQQYWGNPETGLGALGMIVGNAASTGLQFMAPGAMAGRLAQGAQTGSTAARALQFLQNPLGRFGRNAAGQVNLAGRVASGTAAATPVNLGLSQSEEDASATQFRELGQMMEGREGLLPAAARGLGRVAAPFAETGLGRLAFETGLDLAGGGLIEGAAKGASKTAQVVRDVLDNPNPAAPITRLNIPNAPRMGAELARPDMMPSRMPITDPRRMLPAQAGTLPTFGQAPLQGPAIPMRGEIDDPNARLLELAQTPRPASPVQTPASRNPDAWDYVSPVFDAIDRSSPADFEDIVGEMRTALRVADTDGSLRNSLRQQLDQERMLNARRQQSRGVGPTSSSQKIMAAIEAVLGDSPIEIPPVLAPRTPEQQLDLRREMAGSKQQLQADLDDRRALAMPDMEATRQLEMVAQLGQAQRAAQPQPRILPPRAGQSSPEVMNAIARAGAGAAVGGMLGETPEERAGFAAIGAGLGAAGPRALRNVGLSTQEVTPDFVSSLYSRVERQITNAPFTKGTGQQWAAQLAKNTAKGEREFTGIDTFLQENAGKVLTRDEVQQAFNANRVQLAETRYGRTLPQLTDREWNRVEREFRAFYQGPGDRMTAEEWVPIAKQMLANTEAGRQVPDAALTQAARDMAYSAGGLAVKPRFEIGGPEPRWESYTVPGTLENYREVMIQKPGDEVFRYTTHWDEPNVMTHVRMSDRTIDGKKTLFVEEVQDDWAQQARKPVGPKDPETGKRPVRGYRTPEQDAAMAAAKAELDALTQQRRSMQDRNRALSQKADKVFDQITAAFRAGDPELANMLDEKLQRYNDDLAKYRDEFRELSNRWLDAEERLDEFTGRKAPLSGTRPFKQTPEWTELGLKRALDEAVRGGYDQVALITGKQAADVYDLRKQVDRLEWQATMNADAGTLVGYKNGAQVLNESMAADALDDYVGGELAGQLRLRAGEDDNLVGRVAGKDFEVGGKGMQKFYDEMLPNVIKDYSKKLGVPLTVRRINTPNDDTLRLQLRELVQTRTQLRDRAEIDAINQQMRDLRQRILEAEKGVYEGNLVIEITPQVREKILTEGQPLWAMGGDAGLALGGGLAGGTQGETTEERLSNAALLAGTLGARGALGRRWGSAASPFMPAEAMAIAKHGFVELPPGVVRNEAVDRAHTAAVEAIFHATVPAMRAGVLEEGTGVGLFFGDVSPNTIVRFTDDATAQRNAAVRGLAMGQDAQLLIRAAQPNDVPMDPDGFTGTTAGVIITGPNEAALSRADAEAVIQSAMEQGLGGATFDERTGHVLFHNIKAYTGADDQAFVQQVMDAAQQVNVPLDAQYGTFYVDYLNGPAAYFRTLGNDADALRDAARALDALTPEYRAYAQQVGADPAAFEDRLAATRNLIEGRLDALSRSSGPLSQMQAEIAKVKKTSVEQAAALAEADTRRRLKGSRGPIDLSEATPAKRMLRAMKLGMEDMREAMQRFGRDASEWYSKQGRQASAQMQAMIPELRGSPEKRFIADVILAITSSGATVEDNLARAIPIIRQWLDTGQITQLDAYRGMVRGSVDAAGRPVQGPAYALTPAFAPEPGTIRAAGMEGEPVVNPKTGATEIKRLRTGIFRKDLRGSTRLPSLETGLRKLQLFLDNNGGDIEAVRKYFGKDWVSDDGKMTRPMTAEVLGPKIGRFLLNVQGAGDEVTVDTWALRTWMRWMGYAENARLAIDEEEGGKLLLRSGPNPTEQPEIRKAFTKLAQTISTESGQDFKPADVQALLWYLEKYKYGKWGSPSDLVSFADAGNRFLTEGLPVIKQSNVAGQPYTFKFGAQSPTKGLGSAMVREDLSRFGSEGKVYDLGGAVGEGVMDLMRTPGGRELLGKSALTGAGLAMRESEDERLRMTGNAAIGAVLGSLAYKGAIRPAGKALVAGVADGLRQSETGRQLLTALSRDFTTDPRVIEVVNTFRQQLAQGTAVGRELAGEARKLGPQGNRLVSDLVEGEAFEATAGMSPEDMAVATALANRIADAVQVMGQEKVGAGLLSPATLAKRERTYLRRMYAKFDAADAAEDVTVNAKGKTFRIEGERIRNDDLTPEERLAMGEIREADYRLAETFGRGYRDIASAKLFNALREMPGVLQSEYATAFEEAATAQAFHKQLLAERKAATTAAERSALEPLIRDARQAMLEAKGRVRDLQQRFKEAPPADMLGVIKRAGKDDYVRMPDTPSMGVLRGAVVRRDVADYLNDLPEMSSQSSAFGRLLTKWKVIHTVYNTGTQIGNFVSNVSNAHMGGIPWWLQGKAMFWDGAVKDIRTYGPATRALAEAGVLDRGLPLYGDLPSKGLYEDKLALRQLATTTRPETRAQIEATGLKPMGKGEQLARKGQAVVEKSYAMGDAIYRVMLMRKYLKDGLSKEDAVAKVLEYMPTYDTRSPLLKGLRGTVSPFIMYTAKTVPMLLDKIAQHPERWATLAATWAVVDQWSRRKYGAMKEEDLPPNQRMGKTGYFLPQRVQVDALLRPFMDIPANRNPTIDVARFTPLAALTGSPAPGSLATQLGDDVPGILQPGGPLVSLGAQLTNTDPYTGEKLIRPSDTAGDIAAKLGQQAASYVLPSFASFHIPRVIKDLRAGDPDKAAVDALGILGMRPTMVEPGMQALRDLRRFEDQRRDLTTQFRRDLRDTKDPARRRELQQRYREKAQRFRQEYQERRGK